MDCVLPFFFWSSTFLTVSERRKDTHGLYCNAFLVKGAELCGLSGVSRTDHLHSFTICISGRSPKVLVKGVFVFPVHFSSFCWLMFETSLFSGALTFEDTLIAVTSIVLFPFFCSFVFNGWKTELRCVFHSWIMRGEMFLSNHLFQMTEFSATNCLSGSFFRAA